jgi:hypothetical protein
MHQVCSIRQPHPSDVISVTSSPPFGKTLPPFTKAGRCLRSQSNCLGKVERIELGRERGISSRREKGTAPPHRSTCRGPSSTLLSATIRRTGYRKTRHSSEGTTRLRFIISILFYSAESVKDVYINHGDLHADTLTLGINFRSAIMGYGIYIKQLI